MCGVFLPHRIRMMMMSSGGEKREKSVAATLDEWI